ncbi:ABC transporter substrate-binding protein [Microcoleus sp. T2B6]|uniref:ABC transporter substrate-binding protein n=1 Tax=Microcoleus sp. T2B6 TaxID=3055424 RepID=UPI002FD5E6F1
MVYIYVFDRPLMKKPTSRPTALFVTCASLLIACTQTNTPQTSTTVSPGSSPSPATSPQGSAAGNSAAIPVGVGVAQTSNVALLGQEQVAGAKIAEKYFNDKGGVDGTPIRLVFQDTGGDEQGTINAFNTLINQDKVVGIVGPTLSQQAFSANPIADRAKVPVLGPSNTAKGIPQIGDYVARVSAPVAVVAPNAVKAALKQNPNIKKVAVFFAQNDAFSKSETRPLAKIFYDIIKDLEFFKMSVQISSQSSKILWL